MRGNSHVRCEVGENPEIISKGYLSLSMAYIHSEKDILKLVTTLIANTKGDGKAGDEFWTSATRSQTVKSLRTSNGFPLFGELVV